MEELVKNQRLSGRLYDDLKYFENRGYILKLRF
jgi:hypothetical protein